MIYIRQYNEQLYMLFKDKLVCLEFQKPANPSNRHFKIM